MAKREKISFDDFYAALHGTRWPALRESLSRESSGAELNEGLIRPYYLDEASVLAANALDVQPSDKVLDLCAAPGGKALVLAAKLGPEGRLTVNDRSAPRRERLKRVLKEHLPDDLTNRITVTGYDARRWGLYEQNRYDRILLDAPCSSEQHLLRSPRHLAQWTPKRTKRLQVLQYAMLASALLAAKTGGRIVYCTCSVSDGENDGVIEKLLRRKPAAVAVEDIPDVEGEKTARGVRIWPDRADGQGPIYIARLRKTG